jgi:hypothetical protein
MRGRGNVCEDGRKVLTEQRFARYGTKAARGAAPAPSSTPVHGIGGDTPGSPTSLSRCLTRGAADGRIKSAGSRQRAAPGQRRGGGLVDTAKRKCFDKSVDREAPRRYDDEAPRMQGAAPFPTDAGSVRRRGRLGEIRAAGLTGGQTGW